MKGRLIFFLAAAGLLTGLASAYYFNVPRTHQPPAFSPAPNPYPRGIYANGIIESAQSNGENVNLFPEVSGTVSGILVSEGQTVTRGTPLLTSTTPYSGPWWSSSGPRPRRRSTS